VIRNVYGKTVLIINNILRELLKWSIIHISIQFIKIFDS
jgi:hypothetical protein